MTIQSTGFLGFVQFLIRIPGHLEDLSTWANWLKVPFFSDYLLWMVVGMMVVAVLRKTFSRWVVLDGKFAGFRLDPDITMKQLAAKILKSSVGKVEKRLWKALAEGRITAWGRGKVFSHRLLDEHELVLSPVVEEIPREYWKYNRPDLVSVGILGDDTESALAEKGQRKYCKLRFNSGQLKKAGIL